MRHLTASRRSPLAPGSMAPSRITYTPTYLLKTDHILENRYNANMFGNRLGKLDGGDRGRVPSLPSVPLCDRLSLTDTGYSKDILPLLFVTVYNFL